jgi:hypothetical protein
MWPDDEPLERLAGNVMQGTARVPRKSDGELSASRPLAGEELADRLLGKAYAEGCQRLAAQVAEWLSQGG